MYYTFGYLTLEQKYICIDEYGAEFQCQAELICETKIQYREDTSDPNYLQNWVQEMGLMCVERETINMMVSVYYIAFAISGAFFW